MAERILQRYVRDPKTRAAYQASAEFRHLLKLLDGYPLALEVVCANLKRQTPAQILTALQAGDVRLDNPAAQDKTASILKCIDYSHSNLSLQAQALLLCLAPFTSVIHTGSFNNYIKYLQQQPALQSAFSPPRWGGAGGGVFEQWQDVLQEAVNWGLLSPHEVPGYLHVQPTLPYFLRARLTGDQSPASKQKQAEARSPNEQDASASFRFETGD